MAFSKYDPGRIVLILFGIEITGFHSGEFVKCSRDNETFKKDEGSQGDTVRVRSRKKGGKIVFTLQATSPSNKELLKRANLDEKSGASHGSCMLKDLDGNGLAQCENGWLVKPADIAYADEHTPREWTVDCADLTFVEQA